MRVIVALDGGSRAVAAYNEQCEYLYDEDGEAACPSDTRLYEALYMKKAAASVSVVGSSRLERVVTALQADCPEFFYATGSGSYQSTMNVITHYYIDYSATSDQVELRETQLENVARTIVAQCATAATTQEKVRIIHDAICALCVYDMAAAENPDETFWSLYPDSQSAYGALVEGKAVCGGYAKAFEYLCHLCGIPCIYVTGQAQTNVMNGPHAWNLVQIDGVWTLVDVTWDDQGEAETGTVYNFYCISDAQHSGIVSFDNPSAVPAALSLPVREGLPQGRFA